MKWFTVLTLVSALLHETSAAITHVGSGVINAEHCKIYPSGLHTPTNCYLRGAKLLTIHGASGDFSSVKGENSVTLTRVTGTPGTETPTCITGCDHCAVTSGGSFFQCSLYFPKGTPVGQFTLQAFKNGASVGSIAVDLAPPLTPVVASVDGCGDQSNQRRPKMCTNGAPISIWGTQFDFGFKDRNVIGFAANTYGVYSSLRTPYCSGPDYISAPDRGYMLCNLTYPPGVFGEFAVTVRTQGELNTYEAGVEVTVTAGTLTPTPTPTHTDTNTYTNTGTTTPSSTLSRTSTGTATASPTPTATPSPTPTRTPTPSTTATPTLSETPTYTSTPTHSATSTSSITSTPTLTNTPTSTATYTRTTTPSLTQSSTPTSTASQTASLSATPTSTNTPTSSATVSSTLSATATATETASSTVTSTATLSSTSTATYSNTLTMIPTYSGTPTATTSSSATATPTPTATPTATQTETHIPHWSQDLRFTFEVDPDLWTPVMLLEFRKAVARATRIYLKGMNENNIELRGIRFAEDSMEHRRYGFSTVQWRVFGIGFGIKEQSAEYIAMSLFERMPEVNVIMTNSGLPYEHDSLTVLPVAKVPVCRECVVNTDLDLTGLAAPRKCAYNLGDQKMWAAAWDSEITSSACSQLDSATFGIVEL